MTDHSGDNADELILVLDVGTSSVKVAAYDAVGGLVALEHATYPIQTPQPGWAEQNADQWWRAAMAAGRNVVEKVGPQRVAGITVTNQQVTMVPVDANLTPLAPAILWMDTRTGPLVEQIRSSQGDVVLPVAGIPVSTSWAGMRIAWWQRHEPELAATARWFLTVDALMYGRLTGRIVTEESNACFGPFDLRRRAWSKDLLDLIDADASRLPEIVAPTTEIGGLSSEPAATLGLPAGTPVVAGASDQPCSAVGLGAVDETTAAVTLGTGTFVVVPTSRPEPDPRFMISCSAIPGQWIRYGLHYLSSALMEWLSGLLDTSPVELADLASDVDAGSDGLVLLPYFQGARTPYFDDAARGVLSGLTLSHTRGHIARAFLESNAFGVRHVLATISPDTHGTEIRLAGGAINHRATPRMIADVCQRTVRPAASSESTSLGAALVGWTGLGAYPDVTTAASRCVVVGDRVDPDPSLQAVYDESYRTYLDLYRPPPDAAGGDLG